MIVETNRIVRAWLAADLPGRLAALATDAGDTVPAIATFADETTDLQAAQARPAEPFPSCTVMVPDVRVPESEVAQVTRDFEADVLVQVTFAGEQTERNVRDAQYVLRAVLQSLRELHRPEHALAHRTRNQIQLYSCERLTLLGVATQAESTQVTVGLLVTYLGRDITP